MHEISLDSCYPTSVRTLQSNLQENILILNQELTLYSEGFNFSPKIVKVFFSTRQEQTLIIKS